MSQIKKSVGKGGKNEEDDVKAVQELLNKFAKLCEYSKLDEDGEVGAKTLAAIAAFQEKVVMMPRPDMLINPGGATVKKLDENASSVAKEVKEKEGKDEEGGADAGKGKGKGKVTGPINGVGNDIRDFLQAVADHYGKEIKVTSGLRDKKKQAEVMWTYWTKTLKHGTIYKVLKANPKLQQQLDEWWSKGDSSSEKEFKREIEKIAGSLSLHLSGRAVDVATTVDKNIFAVLDANMHFINEKNTEGQTTCYHFDSAGSMPAVNDSMKAKWPKA